MTDEVIGATGSAAVTETVGDPPPAPEPRHRAGPAASYPPPVGYGSAIARPPTTRERLRHPMPTDRLYGWLATLGITAVAFVLRIIHLGRPDYIVFDETYYAKDAFSLVRFGYERSWPDQANDSIARGTPWVVGDDPEFVVHPPVGKYLIGFGEQLFGMNSFGWRFASLVFGCLLIMVTIRLVRRVSRSTVIGCIAGLLLTVDGLAFVMSRIALLDVFLAFFVVAGVGCLAADRDWFRHRLAAHLDRIGRPDLGGTFGPVLLWRPWRLAAGVMFGLALGTKWNALYPIAAFCLLSLAWDIGARRLAGAGPRSALGLVADGGPAFGYQVVLPAVLYVGSWWNWFATGGGWGRRWGADNPDSTLVRHFGATIGSFLHYQSDIYRFHTGDYINQQTHTYDAHPLGWLVIARTIGIDAVNDIKPGTDGCPPGGENCLRVISGIGTPALWWGAVFALLVALVLWVGARDWRFGIPVVGVLSAWLPWFAYTDRPQFFFYAITIIPFSVMATALCLGLLIGPRPDTPEQRRRRLVGTVVAGTFVAVVALNFAYIYPILTDQLLPYSKWLARMWLKGWI